MRADFRGYTRSITSFKNTTPRESIGCSWQQYCCGSALAYVTSEKKLITLQALRSSKLRPRSLSRFRDFAYQAREK